ncbi:non-ribosomal peptide synthetase [Burkholderia gladioli]|uniref:non-ribosomal peptide synthetase n=1 Tax=Burkholderia gladioli TaxID=28095 RepID=UPI00163ED4D4|nr:non-ribosomal peptide synthetase [Burkholderia gladioli]
MSHAPHRPAAESQAAPRVERIAGLSPLQRGMLFHALAAPDSAAYLEQIVCRLDGDVDPVRFGSAFSALVRRHEALRSAFVTRGQSEPRQVIFAEASVPLVVEDWRDHDAASRDAELGRLAEAERRRGFRLNRPPLMRIVLVREGATRWTLIWTHHHIIIDGWSLPLVLNDFLAAYAAPEAVDTAPPAPRYGDYLDWLAAQDRSAEAATWRSLIGTASLPQPLGVDHAAGPGEAAMQMRTLRATLPAAGIARLAAEARVTPGTVLIGACALVLSRLARADEAVFGLVMSGRTAPVARIDQMVGLLANSVVFSVAVPAAQALRDWLGEVQRGQHRLQRLSHCALPDIREALGAESDRPLFECLVAIDNFPLQDTLGESRTGFSISEVRQEEHTHLPLTLNLTPGAERIGIKLGHDAARIDAPAAQAVLDALVHVLERFAAEPAAPLHTIGLRPARPALPAPGSQAGPAGNAPPDLSRRFLEVAAQAGERIAVTDPRGDTSYAALAAQARSIASRLREAGLRPGERVALLLERDATALAAMLAVLLAGGCYVPLDATHPDERLAYLVADSGARHLLAVASSAPRAPQGPRLMLLDDASWQGAEAAADASFALAEPDQPAYVIYTSGSSGQPKGVLVTHANVSRLFSSTHADFGFGPDDVWSCTHSFAFDFSVWELWGALLHGGRVVIVPRETARDPQALLALLSAQGVTMLSQTPSSFRLLDKADAQAQPALPLALRHLVFGGEALHPRDLAGWISRHGDRQPALDNMYGITEITVHATLRRMRADDMELDVSPIGEPLGDLAIRLVDPYGHEVPDGATGEILVSGAGVAAGYLNRPELSAQRFTDDGGGRVYHSGDLARRDARGELCYQGRADDALKIRGYRIEPNEVRAALLSWPAVADAFVSADGDPADARLCAWFVARPGMQVDADGLRRHLEARLPAHEVPSFLIDTAGFALTANGKLDRRALPAPGALRAQRIAPRDADEAALAEVWREALEVAEVGVRDDYFTLGGDSIRSIRVTGLARERGFTFDIADLFRHRTIEALLAAHPRGAAAGVADPVSSAPFALLEAAERAQLPGDVEDAYPLARLQAGMLHHAESGDERDLYYDTMCFHVRATLDPTLVPAALDTLAAAHPVLRTSFLLDGVERPLQLVHRDAVPRAELEDLRELNPDQRKQRFDALPTRLRAERPDPRQPSLVRMVLQRLGEDEWQIGMACHHAILDGWSVARLLADFATLLGGGRPILPRTRYREFVRLEREALDNPHTRDFWKAQLSGAPASALPRWSRGPRQAEVSRMGRHDVVLPAATVAGLLRMSERTGVPLKTLMLAIHLRVLAHATGSQDLVSGVVSNGRPVEADGAAMLGLFLNTVPFRFDVAAHDWTTLARAVAEAELAMFPHRRFPMAAIANLTGLESGSAHFETSFNFVDFHAYDALRRDGGLRVIGSRSHEAVEIPCATTIAVARADDGSRGLTVSLAYDREAFSPLQVEWLADRYVQAAAHCARHPDQAAGHFAEAGAPAPEPLRGEAVEVRAGDLPARLRAVAAAYPRRRAVLGLDGELDYGTLDARSEILAGRLAERGVGIDTVVAIAIAPGDPRLAIALVAVLKAGGASCLIDLERLPPARLRATLEDARPLLLVTTGIDAMQLPPLEVARLTLDADGLVQADREAAGMPARPVVPDAALAYLVFTSGSTGRPKPVAVSHGALAGHMHWMARRFPLNADDVVLQKTAVSFDAAIWEFWAPLAAGATLALAGADASRDTSALAEAAARTGATVVQLVPSLLDVILDDPAALPMLRQMRCVFVGGEALRAASVERFARASQAALVNLYGPAEATIDTTSCVVVEASTDAEVDAVRAARRVQALSLGQPIDNVTVHLLDDRLQPVPVGVAGELWIGGAGLARGYAGRPGETARRFRPDPGPAVPGARLYRTGDLVRRLPDGRLDYLGRADHQIKLRGWRVEPGEIEGLLAAHPNVRRCAVLPRKMADGSLRLLAWIEPIQAADASRERPDYRRFLAERLPLSLVPGAFHETADWPLHPNGKTDRNGFPAADEAPATVPSRAPSTLVEQTLADIWQALLPGRAPIGVDDDFLALGGDSIVSLQVSARARQRGWRISPRDLFDHPTIAALARVAQRANDDARVAAPPGPVPLTAAQARFFALRQPAPAHWNQALMLALPAAPAADTVRDALAAVVAAHDVFRLRFLVDDAGSALQELMAELPAADGWFRAGTLPHDDPQAMLSREAEALQRSLALDTPPLFRALYLRGAADGGARLLLVMHHLIVDGVSWRVLAADLEQALSAQPVAAPQCGFAAWARARHGVAPDEADRRYWQATARRLAQAERLAEPGPCRYADQRTLERELDAAATTRLLRDGASRLHASAQELLLTALAGALADATLSEHAALTIEHHGRGDGSDATLVRTLGWFTTLYPLVIERLEPRSPLARLRATKDALRGVPELGRGHGMHEASGAPAGMLPAVCFNYLGQIDGTLPASAHLALSGEGSGAISDPGNDRGFALDLVAFVMNGRLVMRWIHDAQRLDAARAQRLAEDTLAGLLSLLEIDDARHAAVPSDFPLARLPADAVPVLLEAPVPVVDIWSLTSTQQGMLYHARAAERSAGLYLEQVVATITGECDSARLARAWTQVYARHDALRVSFAWRELDEPVQRVHAPQPITVDTLEVDPLADADAALAAFLAEDRARGLDLERPPLMRVTLLCRDGTPWRLVWTHHHALLDGWSMSILFGELAHCYAADAAGRQPALAAAPSFGRFIADRQRARHLLPNAQAFWRTALGTTAIPTDLGFAPAAGAPEIETERRQLGATLATALHALAARERVTLNTVIEGAWALLLSRIARQREVCFGVTFSGRDTGLADVERMVGALISTLPVPVDCRPGLTVGTFLRQLFGTQSELARHAHCSLVDVQRWSGAVAGQPLFDVVFIYENYPMAQDAGDTVDGLRIGSIEANEASNYPLMLYVKPGRDGLILDAVHDAKRLPRARAAALMDALVALIQALAAQCAGSADSTTLGMLEARPTGIAELPVSPSGEGEPEATLSGMFERALEAAPASEIGGAGHGISRAALFARAGALASSLREAGAGPGTTVAVCLPRGIDLLVALTGVLLAGAAYVPIDPQLPAERRAMMLSDSQAAAIVADPRATPSDLLSANLPVLVVPAAAAGAEAVPLAAARQALADAARVHPEALAYTLFTSGSTGRPKGVDVPHRAFANLLHSFARRYPLGPHDTLCAVTTVSFDIAALELFLPLVTEARLSIVPAAVAANGVALADQLASTGGTLMQATPQTWRLLLSANWQPPRGFRAWCGGEPLPADLAAALLARGVALLDVYGPTETTIWSAARPVTDAATAGRLGDPLDRTRLMVVDADGHPTLPGVTGELLIGGAGLARGYRGAPGRTARAFRPDPLSSSPGARAYATGDLAVRHADGGIGLLGRADDQVKLNGHRIELGEIEIALRAIEAVSDAAVTLHTDPARRPLGLDAHVVWRNADAAWDEVRIRDALASRLPAYMLPQRIFAHAALPRTANGKLDRRALGAHRPADSGAPGTAGPASSRPVASPLDTMICALWRDVFDDESITHGSNFFEIGGNSLLLTRIHARLIQLFGVEPPLGELLACHTPADMAALVVRHESSSGAASRVATAWLQLREMSPAERDALRQRQMQARAALVKQNVVNEEMGNAN